MPYETELGNLAANLLVAIVEASEDAIVSKTLDGIVTSWNQAAERIFGYTEAEMLGRSISLLAPPDHIDEMPRILEKIRRGERIRHYETRRRRKDGRVIDIALTVSAIHDESGRVVGASKIARDITETKRATAELIESEALLRAVLEAIPLGMVVIDEFGVIQYFSAAAERLFGYYANEVLDFNINLLMPSSDCENHDGYTTSYLATGERRIIDLRRVVSGRRKDGSVFPVELSISEVRSQGRRLFTGFVRDLTEQQAQQA